MDDDRSDPFSPTIALATLAREAELRLASALEPHGLTLRKFVLLARLAEVPGIGAGELARRAGVSRPGAETAVRALQGAGFVRAGATGGGHAPQLAVTPAGAELLGRIRSQLAAIDAELFAGETMTALAQALAAATAPPDVAPQD